MNSIAMKRWLVASLVLNLFLAGAIAGGVWRWWNAEKAVVAAASTPPTRGLRYAGDELLPENRRAYRLGLRDARRDAAESVQVARESRLEVMRLLSATQFDRTALVAALTKTREADAALRARVETSIVQFASTLPPEERQKFAAGLARRSTLAGPGPAASAPQKP
jgi:uncharacterized membrane protein